MSNQAWNDGYHGNAQGRGSMHYWGKGASSPEFKAWNAGTQLRASDTAAASANRSTSSFSAASLSTNSTGASTSLGGSFFGGGGGAREFAPFGLRHLISETFFSVLRKTFWLFFIIVPVLYGAYDNIYHRASASESGKSAAAFVFKLSDGLGQTIKQTWPTSSATPVVNGVRVIATWGFALDAGIVAAVGNCTVWAGREVLGFLTGLGAQE